jgi:hypothetical protein
MPDLALFPVPQPLDQTQLSALNAQYVATTVSLGVDATDGIMTVHANSAANCIQRTLKVLLTQKGSVPANSSYGTSLIALSKYGYNPDTINEDIILILLDAETQCKKQDISAGLGVTAQLGSIELLELVLLDTGNLKLSVGIKTAAGITGSFNVQV